MPRLQQARGKRFPLRRWYPPDSPLFALPPCEEAMSTIDEVADFKDRDEAARAQHFQKKFWSRRASQGFLGGEIRYGSVCDVDAQAITRLYELMNARDFKNG